MKILVRCLVLVLPCIAGCKGQLAGVTVHLAADGSGDCEIAGIRDVQYVEDQNAATSGLFQSASEAKTLDLQVRQTKVKFASINAFKAGDISFALEKQGGKNLLTVRIPTEAQSRWFTAWGVSDRSLQLWNRIDEQARKEQKARPRDLKAGGNQFEIPRPPTVLFEINLPGHFEGQDFETVPLGLTTGAALDKADSAALLSIPLSEIHAGQMKELVWKIRFE